MATSEMDLGKPIKINGSRSIFKSNWILENKFPNEKSALDHLMAEQIWSVDPHRCYSVQGGRKVHFRCNRVKANGSLCSLLKCLYIPKNSEEVWLYKTKTMHNHDKTTPPKTKTYNLHRLPNVPNRRKKCTDKMEAALQIRIVQLMKEKMSCKKLLLQLESEGFKVKHREVQIRNYCSNTRKRINKWTFEKSFNAIEDAKLYLNQQEVWTCKSQNRTQLGMTYHYRCKLVPQTGPQCASAKYVSFNKHTNEVTLFQKDCAHTHTNINRKSDMINQLDEEDRKSLIEQDFRILDAVRLKNCLTDSNDNDRSFVESGTNFNYQLKKVAKLNEGHDMKRKVSHIFKTKSQKPLFTSDWIFEQQFPNKQMAREFLAKDKIWDIDTRRIYSVVGGRKVHYRCNKVGINGPQCAAWKCLFYSVDSDVISLYKKNCEHTHDAIAGLQFREENRTDQAKLYLGNSSDAHITKDNHAVSMDLDTESDSLQYVVDYIANDQVNYENDTAQVCQVAALSFDCNSNWMCERSFNTFKEARRYLKESKWCNYKTSTMGGERRIYYRCNMVQKIEFQCDAQVYLSHWVESNKYLIYRNLAQHTHDQIIKTGMESSPQSWNTISEITAPVLNEFTFKEKFMNLTEAMNKMRQETDNWTTYSTKVQNGYRMYFRCNYSNEFGRCTSQVCLLGGNDSDELLYYASNPHNHDVNSCEAETRVILNSEIILSNNNDNDLINSDEAVNNHINYESNLSQLNKVVVPISSDSNSNWMCKKSFDTSEEARSYLKESHWSNVKTCSINGESRIYYRCNLVKKSGPQCAAETYLLRCAETNKSLIFRNLAQHTHDDIIKAKETLITQSQKTISEITDSTEVPATVLSSESNTNWVCENSFPSLEEARKYLKECNWSNVRTSKANGEHRIYYRCNLVKKSGPQCDAQIYLLLCEENNRSIVYRNLAAHTHDTLIAQSIPVTCEAAIDSAENNSNWVCEKSFSTSEEARKYLKETNWSNVRTYTIKGEPRIYYRCNMVRKSGPQCAAQTYLLRCSETTNILLYRNVAQHTHDRIIMEGLAKSTPGWRPISESTAATTNDIAVEDKTASLTDAGETSEIANSANSADYNNEIIQFDDSDNDSLNESATENVQAEWTFETKYSDYETAKNYMKSLNLFNSKSTISKNGVKEYYNCNLIVASDVDHCSASRCLMYENVNNDILIFNRNIRHADICTNAIPPLVPIRLANDDMSLTSDNPILINDPSTIMLIESDENLQYLLPCDEKGLIFEKELVTSQEDIDYLQDKISVNIENVADAACLYKTVQSYKNDALISVAQANRTFETLDDAIKGKINELIMVGNTPKQILTKLEFYNFAGPVKKHIYHWIKNMRQKIRGKTARSKSFIKTIENWLSQITMIPKTDDEQYCVSYNVDHQNKSFRCFLSTRRLLKNAVYSNVVHIDSTCLLYWQQNAIIIIGTTDLDRNLHLFGIAICTNRNECDYEFIFKTIQKGVHDCHNELFKPQCLLTDENEAVYNAFIKTFGLSCKIGMCSEVALSKIFMKLSACSQSDVVKNEIQEDILKIQKVSSQNLFFKAIDLFFYKWRSQTDAQLDEFLNYFKTHWVERNSNWFLGFRYFTSHTNKAIRTEYDVLSNLYIFKQNPLVESFRYYIQIEVEKLSRGSKQFAHNTTIPMYAYEKAIEWTNLEKQFEIDHHDSEISCYVSAGDEKYLCKEKLEKYRTCNHQTLNEFFDIQFSFWCMRRLYNNDSLTCTCPYFLENYVCQHSLAMTSVLKEYYAIANDN